MRRISPKTIIKLTRSFYSKIIPYLPKSSNRGRPQTYPDHQIISMLLIKEVYQLSFRETILLSKDYFKNVPSLRDFHYRASKLMRVIQILIKFIHDYMQRGCVQTIIVDGTGIGFRKKTNLNWMRGTQVRKVKDHIRCEVVLTKGRYKLVQYVEVGRRYASEIKMLRKILDKMELIGRRFLADRLYDVLWLRDYLEGRGIKSVIRVRRNGVGREEVVWEEYKERNEIEGMFGNMKGKLSGYVAAYREDMAMVLALVKFLAYNMYVAYFLSLFLARLWPVYLLLSISHMDF